MQSFADKTGQPWQLDLTVGDVIRIRGTDGQFDLFDPLKNDLAQRLASDLPSFWELLWLLVEPQAAERSIDAIAFGKLMAANCLIEAQHKFLEEWRSFFLSLQRPEMATVLEKLAAYNATALELVKAKLSSPTLTGLDKRVRLKMESDLNARFGELEADLDSTLDPSPTAASP